jgi:hypothetical protein
MPLATPPPQARNSPYFCLRDSPSGASEWLLGALPADYNAQIEEAG